MTRLVAVPILFAALLGVHAHVDLKAVFAFGDTLFSIKLPAFNYEILTTVDNTARKIAVSFPPEPDAAVAPPHLEIVLEFLDPSVTGDDYFQHYVSRYKESLAASEAPVEEQPTISVQLPDSRMELLTFVSATLEAHKTLLITSRNGDIGIVMVLDTAQDLYETNRQVFTTIIESIRLE